MYHFHGYVFLSKFVRYFGLAGFLFILAFGMRCEQPSIPSADSLPGLGPLPDVQSTVDSGSALPEWKKNIQSLGISPSLSQPYSLLCYYGFVDTLDSMPESYFAIKIRDIFAKEASGIITANWHSDPSKAEILLGSPNPPSLDKLGNQEWIGAIVVSIPHRKIEFRLFHALLGFLCYESSQTFTDPMQIPSLVWEMFVYAFPWEGYIIETKDKEISVVFRGKESECICQAAMGSHFFLLQGNEILPDSLVFVEKVSLVQGYELGFGKFMGLSKPKSGMRIVLAHLLSGTQKIRLINPDAEKQEKQSGFSIFASSQQFSIQKEHYLTTIDSSGEFILEIKQKKPMFVCITQNVDGVNFPFVRKLILLTPGRKTIDIWILGLEELQKKSESLSEEISEEQAQWIQRQMQDYIEQAQDSIQSDDLNRAMVSLRMAQHCLKKIEKSLPRNELRRTLEDVEKTYRLQRDKREAKDQYEFAIEFIKQADEHVQKLEWEEAQKKLAKAKALWPAKFYESEYPKLVEREKRLGSLIKEDSQSLGKARRFLKLALQWNPEEITREKLMQIHEHLKILHQQGIRDENMYYNDLDLWLKTKVFLDKLSQGFAEKSKYYQQEYHKAQETQKREELYKIQQMYFQYSQWIDRWLLEYK